MEAVLLEQVIVEELGDAARLSVARDDASVAGEQERAVDILSDAGRGTT